MCNMNKKNTVHKGTLSDPDLVALEIMEEFCDTMFPSEGGKVLVPASKFMIMQTHLLDYYKLLGMLEKEDLELCEEELELQEETYGNAMSKLRFIERIIRLKEVIDKRNETDGK